MKNYSLILSAVLLIVLTVKFNSCQKETQKTFDPNEKDFLSYWLFAEDSYWVYSVNNSNVYDTARITRIQKHNDLETHIDKDYHSKGPIYNAFISHSNTQIYGSYYTNEQEYRSGSRRVNYDDWIMFQNFNTTNPDPPILGNFIIFNFPYKVGELIWQTAQIESETNLVTEAGTFDKTVIVRPHIYDWYDSTKKNYIKRLYLTKDIGTTKIVLTNDITLELVDYYVKAYR